MHLVILDLIQLPVCNYLSHAHRGRLILKSASIQILNCATCHVQARNLSPGRRDLLESTCFPHILGLQHHLRVELGDYPHHGVVGVHEDAQCARRHRCEQQTLHTQAVR